jgi:hypothetical protein
LPFGVLRSNAAGEHRMQAGRSRQGAAIAVDCLSVALAAALGSGLVTTLVALLSVGHPDMGWSDVLVADAKAAATGHFPYGNPAEQYVGFFYTPLFVGVQAVLLRVYWWEGWGAVVSMLSVAAALSSLSRLANLGPSRSRWRAVAPAAAVVAFTLSAFTLLPVHCVFEARGDQLAWALFVVAAARITADVTSSEPRRLRGRVVTGALLALSVLAKQTTLLPCAVAAAIAAQSQWPASAWRQLTQLDAWKKRAPVELAVLAGVTAAVLGMLQLASEGYAYDLLFQLPWRHARLFTLAQVARVATQLLLIPCGVLASVATIDRTLGFWRRRASKPTSGQRGAGEHRPGQRIGAVVCACLLAAATLPGAFLGFAKQGGGSNQLIGAVWGMALILAALLGTGAAWQRRATAFAASVLLLLASVGPVPAFAARKELAVPKLVLRQRWSEVPAELVAAQERGLNVFDWNWPSLSVVESGTKPPGLGSIAELGAAGYMPRWFVRNVIQGRYDLIRPYVTPSIAELFASGFGQRDAALLWKINYVINAGYEPVHDFRQGVTFYRPGPRLTDVQWLASCFAPYRAGSLDIVVRRGGGLWCATGGALTLKDAPGPASELVLRALRRQYSFDVQFQKAPARVVFHELDGEGQKAGPIVVLSTLAGANGILMTCGSLTTSAASASFAVELAPRQRGLRCRARGSSLLVVAGSRATGEPIRLSMTYDLASAPRLANFRMDGHAVSLDVHDPTPDDLQQN